jgi:hypothetical protein
LYFTMNGLCEPDDRQFIILSLLVYYWMAQSICLEGRAAGIVFLNQGLGERQKTASHVARACPSRFVSCATRVGAC